MVQFKSLLDTMRGLLFFQLKKATISLYMEVVALFLDYKYFVLMKILRGTFSINNPDFAPMSPHSNLFLIVELAAIHAFLL